MFKISATIGVLVLAATLLPAQHQAIVVNSQGNVGIGTGTEAPLAKLTVDGNLIRRVKIATDTGPDETTNNGRVLSRTLVFTKTYEDTVLRILYSDNLRISPSGSATSCAARWEIRFNGNAAPGGYLRFEKYVRTGDVTGPIDNNPMTFVGYAQGLAAGTYAIQVWGEQMDGHNATNIITGWHNTTWTIEAEEHWVDE